MRLCAQIEGTETGIRWAFAGNSATELGKGPHRRTDRLPVEVPLLSACGTRIWTFGGKLRPFLQVSQGLGGHFKSFAVGFDDPCEFSNLFFGSSGHTQWTDEARFRPEPRQMSCPN
jgi:hypothetical protein